MILKEDTLNELVKLFPNISKNDIEIIYRTGYVEAQKQAINKTAEWLQERCSFGIHPCGGVQLVADYKQFTAKENE